MNPKDAFEETKEHINDNYAEKGKPFSNKEIIKLISRAIVRVSVGRLGMMVTYIKLQAKGLFKSEHKDSSPTLND